MKRNIFIIAFLTVRFLLSAQAVADIPLFDKYKGEQAVFLSRKLEANIAIKNDEPVVTARNSEELLLLTEQTTGYSERKIYFSSFTDISGILAKSVITDEQNRSKTIPVTSFPESNELSDVSFYDDYKAKRIVFPSLARGAHTQLSYTETYKEPRFFGRFYFNTYAPAELAEVSISVPPGVKIGWKIFHAGNGEIEHTNKTVGENTLYSWKGRNRKRFDIENDAPELPYYTPHIVVYIESYTAKNEEKKLLGSPGLLYKWYSGMIPAETTESDSLMKLIADSITRGAGDEREKMKRIFYWVQDHVKYVAFEDGMGGFIPRKASRVCERRFGDCKDMASIITGLARSQGISNVYLTWIGTRSIPYSYYDVPTPVSDNHMIATYIHDGQYYFLDATGKNTPWGKPTAMIQGKEALIGKGNSFEIAKVPLIAADQNVSNDVTTLRIDGNLVRGQGKLKLTGYPAIYTGERLKSMVNEKDRNEFLTAMVSKGNNKFATDQVSAETPASREEALVINYNWQLDNYVRINGDEIYLNPSLEKSYQNLTFDTTLRRIPYEFNYKTMDKNVISVEIPAGYTATYIPENSSFKNEKFGFEIRYTLSGNTILAEKTIRIDTLMIMPSDFIEWNKMIKKLNATYKEAILFKKQGQ
ncbi:MAG: transglutaminase [Bacteroidetes bacterium]|nr:MAG: transglutaminase [Bacteroidota bacterium]